MLFPTILGLGLLFILLYLIQFSIYLGALYKEIKPYAEIIAEDPFVTLIVPFRNEEAVLKTLLESIRNQSYPASQIELILVDDHSEDGSFELISGYSDKMECLLKLISLDDSFGKKHAIDRGIKEARGDWIIQTDADVSLGAGFIRSHVRASMEGDVKLIAGPVALRRKRGFSARFEALDFLSMQAVTIASFNLDKPLMCNGANLSYSRKFYFECREELLKVPSPSGDDMFLLSMAKKTDSKIEYLNTQEALVLSSPTNSFRNFIKQRIRWGSKARLYTDPDQIWLTLLVWLANTSLLVFFVSALFREIFFLPLVIAWFVKALLDFHIVIKASYFFRQQYLVSSFFLAAVFYYFYLSITGVLAMFSKINWKGRKY